MPALLRSDTKVPNLYANLFYMNLQNPYLQEKHLYRIFVYSTYTPNGTIHRICPQIPPDHFQVGRGAAIANPYAQVGNRLGTLGSRLPVLRPARRGKNIVRQNFCKNNKLPASHRQRRSLQRMRVVRSIQRTKVAQYRRTRCRIQQLGR